MLHSYPIAITDERALAAQRRDRLTDMLSIGDQQVVEDDPVFAGKFLAEGLFGFVRAFRRHISPPIADPMHVNINTDTRLSIAHRDDQIRRFTPDPGQRLQLIERIGNMVIISFEELRADLLNLFGFCPVKPDWVNGFFDGI